jgi:hypothetical protein
MQATIDIRKEVQMPKKISITFLFTVVIAIAALFAATVAVAANGVPDLGDGVCDPSEEELFQCFESAGYVVEILQINGEFPQIIAGNSVFNYRITEKGSEFIKYINLLIPAAQDLEILSSTPPQRMLFTGAQGDKSSKFGRGLTLYNTVRLDKYNGKSGDISLTLRDKVPVIHNAMGLIPNSNPSSWGKGEILLPGGLPQENADNEPIASEKLFKGAEFDWKLIYDEGGNSFDVECVPRGACMVETLLVNKIPFGTGGLLNSLPIDEPFVASDSPGCTYVRTRSGGVKKLCN